MRRRFWHVALDKLGCATLAKHYRIAADPFAVRMILKVLRDRRERSRQVNIITINETKDLSRSFLETFVDSVHLASVFFTDPERQPVLVTSDDIYSFIRAAAVNYDVFKIWIILIEN